MQTIAGATSFNPLGRYLPKPQQSTDPSTGDKITGALSKTGEGLAKVYNFSTSIFILLTGLCATGGFGLAKSLAPDHTFVDKFSLAGIMGGLMTCAFGLVRLWKGQSQQQASISKSEKTEEPTRLFISDMLRDKVIKKLNKLGEDPNPDFKLGKKILDCTYAPELDEAAKALIGCYKDKEFSTSIIQSKGQGKFLYDKGENSTTDVSTSQIQERMAVLIAYVVGAGGADEKDIKDILDLKRIEAEQTSAERLEYLLPDEFVLVYQAARNYKDDSLKMPKGTKPGPNNKDSMSIFALQCSYMRTLKQAIEFVRTVKREEEAGNADPKRVKKATIIRSALIAGLKLDTKTPEGGTTTVKESIDKKLKTEFDKDSGVSKKMEQAEACLQELRSGCAGSKYSFEEQTFTSPEMFSEIKLVQFCEQVN